VWPKKKDTVNNHH